MLEIVTDVKQNLKSIDLELTIDPASAPSHGE